MSHWSGLMLVANNIVRPCPFYLDAISVGYPLKVVKSDFNWDPKVNAYLVLRRI